MRLSAPVRLLLAIVPMTFATAVHGQAPGYQQLDNRMIMAEYFAEVIEEVNEIMAEWGQAWAVDDVATLTDLYWDTAVLIPIGGDPLRGQDAIREHLGEALPDQGGMEAFMLDFDASGGMAVVYGNYMVSVDGEERSGPLVTVYLKRGRTWKIRSQVFSTR